jgi:hypothetical protein
MYRLAFALTVLVLTLSSVAEAAPQPPTDLDPPALVTYAWCGVRLHFYDFVPEDPNWWRAVALYIGNEQRWFALLVWPYPGSESLDFWVDFNRDGRPDRHEIWTNDNFEATYTWSACEIARRLGMLQ